MDIERILDLIFPPICLKCRKIGEWICSDCYQKFFKLNQEECFVCREDNFNYMTHDKCLKAGLIEQCVICWCYNKLSKKIMKAFKYDYRYAISNYLSKKVVENFKKYISSEKILVPVPTHRSKLRQRGFNQSKLLAEKIGKLTNQKMIEPLERVIDSHQHAGMSRNERISDINPFKLIDGYKNYLVNKNILLIDDVCTTGTTLIQCAEELKKGNPKSISAITLFRGKR